MRDLLEFVLGVIVLIVLWNNRELVIEVCGAVLTMVCDFIIGICHEIGMSVK